MLPNPWENKRAALDELKYDKVANSARASKACAWATWQRMHRAWFGEGSPPLPLTADKIRAVAAWFKAGHYASFAIYACAAEKRTRSDASAVSLANVLAPSCLGSQVAAPAVTGEPDM